jgi:translation initiation factor IF-3
MEPQAPTSGPMYNEFIKASSVRVIGAEGENVGVLGIAEARALAAEAGLDLVEISPGAEPPVCKILDVGKYKYEAQKKAAVARKNQKTQDIKEIKLRPGIDDHDYEVKLRAVQRFIEEGDKVKVTLRFKGREMAHNEYGMRVMERMKNDSLEFTKVETEPRFEGRQMLMLLAPK